MSPRPIVLSLFIIRLSEAGIEEMVWKRGPDSKPPRHMVQASDGCKAPVKAVEIDHHATEFSNRYTWTRPLTKTTLSPAMSTQSAEARRQGTANNKSESARNSEVFVAGIPFDVSDSDLRAHFEQYGAVRDVSVINFHEAHRRNFGYIEFAEPESVLQALNDRSHMISGMQVDVQGSTAKASDESKTEGVILGQPLHHVQSKPSEGSFCAGAEKTLDEAAGWKRHNAAELEAAAAAAVAEATRAKQAAAKKTAEEALAKRRRLELESEALRLTAAAAAARKAAAERAQEEAEARRQHADFEAKAAAAAADAAAAVVAVKRAAEAALTAEAERAVAVAEQAEAAALHADQKAGFANRESRIAAAVAAQASSRAVAGRRVAGSMIAGAEGRGKEPTQQPAAARSRPGHPAQIRHGPRPSGIPVGAFLDVSAARDICVTFTEALVTVLAVQSVFIGACICFRCRSHHDVSTSMDEEFALLAA